MYGFRKCSRILNDKRFVFSLSMKDFIGIVAVFVILSSILDDTPYALLAFVGAVVFGVGLSPIRIKHRDHFIRDSLMFAFLRMMRGRL